VSGIASRSVRGVEKVLIWVVKLKKTKTRPLRAGFAQFAPSPPNVHLATKIAKKEATIGMKSGIEGGMFKPTRKPVRTADPSQMVHSLPIFPSRNSVNAALTIETRMITRLYSPKT
jgi:hypothetical protein